MGRPMLGAPRNSSGREQLELLLPLTEGRRVEKVRDLEPTGSCVVEDWLGTEVTGDECYANETFAARGLPVEGER